MLLARFVQREACYPSRRHFSSSGFSSTLKNIWERVKGFLTESEKENFHDDCIRRSHKSDGINDEEWMLIYRDQGASRSFLAVSIAFPAFIAGLGMLGYELYTKAHSERNRLVQRLVTDVKEIGLLALLPGTAVLVVIFILLRLHQLRLLRIYQNRRNVDDYLAIGSKRIVEKHQLPFNRNCAAACYFSEEKEGILKLLTEAFLGNFQVENRRFLISDDSFRANNYRTYMLNETSIPPRLQG
ncbi:unnamed protein product [Cylicocyclus nassatus]|uniref:Transmembrane protein n=1 Tax=Cylicocyclus nassatus TaxID=53992 RepID=A0AA36DKK7_CYLNA|nr:unnamed protein product [Cylicocyclus nassatus]